MKDKIIVKILSVVSSIVIVASAFVPLNLIAGAETGIWDGTLKEPTNGSGTYNSPVEITSAEELAWLVTQTKDTTKDKYYKLTANIKINDTSAENWQESATPWFVQNAAADNEIFFAGHFDGNGHTVSGLYFGDKLNTLQSSLGYWSLSAGLFPNLATGASVENLGIINSKITAVDICAEKGDVYAGLQQ